MEAAFEAYFSAADLDRDGRISGQEAVSFFRASALPQPVLAQIWTYADKNRTGFLGREDFYNALRLVTVAQSGRELTPDIVRSALYGPAAAKIPAPRINVSTPVPNASSPLQPTQAPHPAQQSPAIRASQAPPGVPLNPLVLQPGNVIRPPQASIANTPAQAIAPRAPAGGVMNHTGPAMTGLSTDWFSGKKSASPLGVTPQTPTRGVSPQVNLATAGIPTQASTPVAGYGSQAAASTTSAKANSADLNLLSSSPAANDSKAVVPLGNGLSSASTFGVDPFALTPQAKQDSSSPPVVSNSLPSANALGPSAGPHHPPKPMQTGPMQGVASLPSQPAPKQNQLNTTPGAPAQMGASFHGQIPSNTNQSQAPWPKITQVDVRKYMIVFIKVDRDRDGKITGEEARNLFLSWRLPRDILRKVWDLSDQDKDGMLSFKEFCTAVYLMERFREQRPLPDVLPDGIWAEGISLPSTGQFAENPTGPAPHPSAGRAMPGQHHGMPPSSMKPPPRRPLSMDDDDAVRTEKQKPKIPVLEEHLTGQLSKEEQSALDAKFKEASEADKKVQELEKEILDSREKTEFYRTKMQELILYKSRCDNRINEVSERMSADKREVQSLAAKYDERCKKVGDVASKLSMDEATFREIQEKKLEIYNAIVKLQKGDGNDEKLQERANQIQTDLEELVKSLNEQCKRYGLRAKPTTLVELPFGWQPGIQETAGLWDEEWDKFGDDGFSIIKELTVEVEPRVVQENQPTVEDSKVSTNGPSAATSTEKEDSRGDKSVTVSEQTAEPDATPSNSKASAAKSPPVSPVKNTKDDHTDDRDKKQSGTNDTSSHAAESVSNHGATYSPVHGEKTYDSHSWGPSFDHGDDNDSLWNFNHKDGENGDSDLFFGPQGLPPIRTGGSSMSGSVYGKEQKPSFDSVPGTPVEKPFFDSVPGTPLQKSVFDYSVPSTPMQKSVFDYSVPSTPLQKSLFDSVPSTPMQKSVFDSVPSTPMQNSLFDSFPSTPMQRSLFDSGPSRAESPTASSIYGKEQRGFFDSSVPSTPMYNSSFSPRYSEAGDDSSFDTFSQMDSFGMNDSNSFGQRDSFSRFDSFRSNADQGGNDTFGRFDSFRSNADQGGGNSFMSRGYSFDEDDPFGTGPFKSSDTSSPTKHGTDRWSAF
uniref:Uncharacterized protein n=1 Tax=Leersia perrieri TaxID=77586 RepID=A0A0D9WUD1_9ORYZ